MRLVVCFVLKNTPPRLEVVAPGGSSGFETVETPSLDEVETILQKCNKTARDIPDDQCLVLKTQRARFPATKNIAGILDAYLGLRKTDRPGKMVKTKILDRHGHPVGQYVAERIGESDYEEQMERDFISLGCGPGEKRGRKTVHVLEVELKDGIWYRVDAADIDQEAWNEAVVSEELVILG